MNKTPKAAVIMGSDSDFPVVKKCIAMLKKFGIEADVNVISAHRTPDAAAEYAKNAEANGIDVIIAAAGKAAHLAGVLAAFTTLPVIGIPMKSSTLDGLDSLLSMVQMPKGIPVANVAIDGADNAGILAAQILALKYEEIKPLLVQFKKDMAEEVEKKNLAIKKEAAEL
ncbi:MAG: 5-(carboxyamino)imidazole ribonucleotide mutase [Ruminococcaceae bacterium]|nr:5-(carboxyamino)imidazole ribonucleotide mutase [Oscillospiraceae bacterium]